MLALPFPIHDLILERSGGLGIPDGEVCHVCSIAQMRK
jgi:hypothetical protein